MKPVSLDPAMTARAALLNSTATILPLRGRWRKAAKTTT